MLKPCVYLQGLQSTLFTHQRHMRPTLNQDGAKSVWDCVLSKSSVWHSMCRKPCCSIVEPWQWSFLEPRLKVPTVYKVYAMQGLCRGICPQNMALYGTVPHFWVAEMGHWPWLFICFPWDQVTDMRTAKPARFPKVHREYRSWVKSSFLQTQNNKTTQDKKHNAHKTW